MEKIPIIYVTYRDCSGEMFNNDNKNIPLMSLIPIPEKLKGIPLNRLIMGIVIANKNKLILST